jgi:gas vesicle protein
MENKNKGIVNNGFTIGFVLGTALALLYATKKGRKILKAISEEGGQNIGEIKKHLKNFEAEIEDDLLCDEMEEATPVKIPVVEENNHKNQVEEKSVEPESNKGERRLFKGIPKKS